MYYDDDDDDDSICGPGDICTKTVPAVMMILMVMMSAQNLYGQLFPFALFRGS